MDNYYDIPALSASGINAFDRSPAHYWRESPFNPNRITQPETPAKLLGKVCHKLILEPDTFFQEYVIEPVINKRSNAGKAEYAEWCAANTDNTVITEDIFIHGERMARAIRKHPGASKLLSIGESEKPLLWNNGSIACKGKMDRYREGLIIDYKTTDDASEAAFSRSIAKWGYHRQDSWYMRGAEIALNERPRGFVFIVQEKDVEENIGIYSLAERDRQIGEIENERITGQIVRRLQANDWRSYPKNIITTSLPTYYKR